MPISPTILLVEDDENDVLFLKMAMRQTGVLNPLQVAVDGRQALEYLHGTDPYSDRQAYPLPCLVLLDLKLPYIKGLDVLHTIRQDAELKQLIVIILTSSQAESDIDQAYSLGINAYVVKPANTEELQKLTQAIKDFWLVYNLPPRAVRK